MGNFKFNNGSTLQDKQDGIGLLLQGIKKLQTWIDREGDPVKIQRLKAIYQDKHNSIGEKMTLLEANKNGF